MKLIENRRDEPKEQSCQLIINYCCKVIETSAERGFNFHNNERKQWLHPHHPAHHRAKPDRIVMWVACFGCLYSYRHVYLLVLAKTKRGYCTVHYEQPLLSGYRTFYGQTRFWEKSIRLLSIFLLDYLEKKNPLSVYHT